MRGTTGDPTLDVLIVIGALCGLVLLFGAVHYGFVVAERLSPRFHRWLDRHAGPRTWSDPW